MADRINSSQKRALLEYMKTHKVLAKGNNSDPELPIYKNEIRALWEDLRQILDNLGPPTHSVEEWKRVFDNLKTNLKRKMRNSATYARVTGKGPSRKQLIFSDIEKGLIRLANLEESLKPVERSETVSQNRICNDPIAGSFNIDQIELDSTLSCDDPQEINRDKKRPKHIDKGENMMKYLEEQMKNQKESSQKLIELQNIQINQNNILIEQNKEIINILKNLKNAGKDHHAIKIEPEEFIDNDNEYDGINTEEEPISMINCGLCDDESHHVFVKIENETDY